MAKLLSCHCKKNTWLYSFLNCSQTLLASSLLHNRLMCTCGRLRQQSEMTEQTGAILLTKKLIDGNSLKLSDHTMEMGRYWYNHNVWSYCFTKHWLYSSPLPETTKCLAWCKVMFYRSWSNRWFLKPMRLHRFMSYDKYLVVRQYFQFLS